MCLATEPGPELLAKVHEILRPGHGVCGLRGHGLQEELQPLLDLASLAHCLQSFVVRRPVLLEVSAEVEQGSSDPLLLQEVEDDEDASEPAVAVQERVDRLELGVDQRRLDDRRMGGASHV